MENINIDREIFHYVRAILDKMLGDRMFHFNRENSPDFITGSADDWLTV